jgi:hypothetical protein
MAHFMFTVFSQLLREDERSCVLVWRRELPCYRLSKSNTWHPFATVFRSIASIYNAGLRASRGGSLMPRSLDHSFSSSIKFIFPKR